MGREAVLVVRRTQVTRRHLPRSLPIQTQRNGFQPHSHGTPCRGEYGSRLVRHGPRFLAYGEADRIRDGGGAGEGLEFKHLNVFYSELGFVVCGHLGHSGIQETIIKAAVKPFLPMIPNLSAFRNRIPS